MAVIVRKRVIFGDREMELATYQPPGSISKDERLRADTLDQVLRERVPQIARQVLEKASSNRLVLRWYILGRELREILGDRKLAVITDIESGVIWPAIWQYLPESLKPPGLRDAGSYDAYRKRRKDHLALAYELSEFEWSDVQWIKRFEDWYEIASRPGLIRDNRILRILGKRIKTLAKYPSPDQLRAIAKGLVKAFPTRRLRDSSLLSDEYIGNAVKQVIDSVVKRTSD